MPWYVEVLRAVVGTIIIFSGVAIVTAMLGVLLERRISAWIQSRLGPTHVGPRGLLQTVADTVKLLQKEYIVPRSADTVIFASAVVVVPLAALLDYVVLPFGTTRWGPLIYRDLNIGVLYFAATSSLIVVGILMAGWGSNNKYALIGGLRSAAQMVSYEIPIGLVLITIAMLAGSLSTVTIVNAQTRLWFIVSQPVSFVIFLIAAVAEVNRAPFDLVEAESELVAGLLLRIHRDALRAVPARRIRRDVRDGGPRGDAVPRRVAGPRPAVGRLVSDQALRPGVRLHVGALDLPALPDRPAAELLVEGPDPRGAREPRRDGVFRDGRAPMTGEALAFYLLAAITLASGLVVVTSPNLVHSAVALVPALLGVTGLYILLNAEFLAGIQVLIYAGGITVLILFVIMLTEGGTGLRVPQRNEQGPIGAAVAGAIAAILIAVASRTPWAQGSGVLPSYTPGAIGESFLGPNLLLFEGTSVVLLVTLVGAILIARKED